jgi:hypothetical protein
MNFKPNKHWRIEVVRFWKELHAEFSFERDSVEILRVALDSYHDFLVARDEILKDGVTITSPSGQMRQHPCWQVERYARESFLRYMRALGISDTGVKAVGRPGLSGMP